MKVDVDRIMNSPMGKMIKKLNAGELSDEEFDKKYVTVLENGDRIVTLPSDSMGIRFPCLFEKQEDGTFRISKKNFPDMEDK